MLQARCTQATPALSCRLGGVTGDTRRTLRTYLWQITTESFGTFLDGGFIIFQSSSLSSDEKP